MLGVDRAVGYGVLVRVWSLLAGPVTMLLIASRFSPEQQGFYFTLSSLLAMQVFFELGLLTVIAQFASHEFVGLRWGERGAIEGDAVAKERFIELLSKSVKWYGTAAALLILILAPAGVVFLKLKSQHAGQFQWLLPWLLATVGTGCNLLTVPFYAVITGSGDVATVNFREMLGAVIGSLLSWSVIWFGGGLYSVFAVCSGNIIISWLYLWRNKPLLLKEVWAYVGARKTGEPRCSHISWGDEIWPMQWKIAVSWMSGYLLYQLFNPVLFYYHGPVVAGQMGMSLNIANALFAGSMTWISTKSPEFGKLIALNDWKRLDKVFYGAAIKSLSVSVVGAVIGLALIAWLKANFVIGNRFLSVGQIALLLAATIGLVLVNCFAVYMRAHKTEPLMKITVLIALVQAVALWYLGAKYSSLGMVAGYMCVNLLLMLPLTVRVWRVTRREWHC